MPIIIYRVVHTGAKSQLGGLKEGLFKVTNQSLTDEAVKNPEIAPTARGIIIEIISLTMGFIIYFN